MYLITIEGGDGSGKGLATKVVSEVMRKEFPFVSVDETGEPRRDHPLGRLAIDSVRKKITSPEREAGLFAADRLDHSHGWILPRLESGIGVVSERNIHSSLVYQGIVGGLGVERVAHMNSAALVPDLCIWVDCDPSVALDRIKSGTLRAHSDKEEYFETSELQMMIRHGYQELLSGNIEMPTPFDMGAIIGPVLNEGSEDDFKMKLKYLIRNFMHSRPEPVNVLSEVVDRNLVSELIISSRGQSTLQGLGVKPAIGEQEWLDGSSPWRVLKNFQKAHSDILGELLDGERSDVPKKVLSHSFSSICGTLSLMRTANIRELRKSLGPVRSVSERHTQTIVRYLNEKLGCIHQHRALIGREAPRSQMNDESRPFGRLVIAIWPLRDILMKWMKKNPDTHIRFAMGQIIRSGKYPSAVKSTLERIAILGPGRGSYPLPKDENDLISWWTMKSI
ncbi:MAG TPA: dTMP kinase [Candidatus Thalassarchaeaceae archaeon]|jgi:dTMP kinase|nr:dTMP kinase [Euryarchaeota archaeon]DAC43346.1 MAG TPA: dTMP kinase [Candidatus Poseidoniales archaeon]HII35093.1 dTMP kinase [Candidatus Thalassarchaeaceae archaeon]|tara:strand:- start:14308 stop:15654 length:1347 start_codon:yes stop_codon:yes gene_type:complete